MNEAPYAVRLTPLAIDDLVTLHCWVAEGAGREVADDYLGRVEARLDALAHFPRRGTPRNDLAPGLRTLAFERRLLIAYRVGSGTVDILRVVNGLRDLTPLITGGS